MTNKQISQEHQRQSTGQNTGRNTGMQNPSSQSPSRNAQGTDQRDTQTAKSGRSDDSDRRGMSGRTNTNR